MGYYILIKRKGTGKALGVIPAKKKATKTALQKAIRNNVKKGYSAKIITASQLKKLLVRLKPKKGMVRRKRRKVRRKRRKVRRVKKKRRR